jgi:sugar phosphate isomerase/epimerase
MRIAVSTVAFPGVALNDLPRAARAVGAEGIALGVSPTALATITTDFLRLCHDSAVRVSAVYGYAGRRLVSGDPTEDIDLARRCIDLAARLEAPVCRLFAGTTPGPDAAIDRFIEACRPVVAHAAGAGVRLGLPTHHDLAFDPRSCRRLIEGLGRANAGIIFTGANLERDGIAPLAALAEMQALVIQAEIKDWTRHGSDAHPVPIGTGEAMVWPLIEALSGLDIWVTLHHLRQHHPDLPPLDPAIAATARRILHGR